MTHPKYMAVPTILINEPYQLSFRYPDWANGNEPTTRTYILGKTKDGKIGHLTYLGDIENRKKGRDIYSPEDTAKKMTHVIKMLSRARRSVWKRCWVVGVTSNIRVVGM